MSAASLVPFLGPVPRISEFYGVVITMFFGDHLPPHFHARYAEHSATIAIETLECLKGRLPRRAWSLVVEWAIINRDALRANWTKTISGEPLDRVPPLR